MLVFPRVEVVSVSVPVQLTPRCHSLSFGAIGNLMSFIEPGVEFDMSSEAFEQSVDVLRRSEADYKSKCNEVVSLRQRLTDMQVELEKTKIDLRKSEIRCEGLAKDVDKRQQAIDIIVKELTAKRQIVEQVTVENQRLKRDLEAATRHGGEMQGTIRAKSIANNELSKEHDAPAALYMQQCFSVGCDPSLEIMRCLFSSTEITAVNQPATYQQLGTLVDMFTNKEKFNSSGWQAFDTINLAVDHQESFHQVVELINALPSLTSVTLHGLGDPAAPAVASALATAESVTALELPNLCVSDTGFASIMKVIQNREILSIQKGAPLLQVKDLDLSQCLLSDQRSFQAIHGQCLSNINLSGATSLHDGQLGEMLRECPGLAKLGLAGCTGLTNEALSAINRSGVLYELDLTGCTGIRSVKLSSIEVLHTDLAGVTFFEPAKLRILPKPITHFQCLSWSTPELRELTIQSVSLHPRELTLLAECGNLTHLSFLKCRLQGLSAFLNRMRRLVKLSVHSCKGIVDSDILAVCSTIEILDLTDCFCLTDKALIKVSDVCRQLRELTLKRCSNITDAGVIQLERNDHLEYLNVLGAKKVSVLALHRVISAVPSLKHIVHETLITAAVRVEREDEEEAVRTRLFDEERNILHQREGLGATYNATSPTKSQPGTPRLTTPADGRRSTESSQQQHSPIPKPPKKQEELVQQEPIAEGVPPAASDAPIAAL